jgi:small subunit ribosomal protein S5
LAKQDRFRDRDRKEKSDVVENVIAISRVAKVVKGGRRFSFSALVVVGNGSGKVGIGLGKTNGPIRKASEAAKRSRRIFRWWDDDSLGRRHYGAAACAQAERARTGVIAGEPVRAILEAGGVSDILTKALGTNNPHNVTKATMNALSQLESAEQVARRRGMSVQRMFGLPERAPRKKKAEGVVAEVAGGETA